MHRIIPALLLALLGTSAAADWVKLGDNPISTLYTDPATTLKTGDRVTMWDLVDLKAAMVSDGKRYMSVKAQHEYDCTAERTRTLSFSCQSANMGGGVAVCVNDQPGEWAPVAPGGGGNARLLKLACGKQAFEKD